MFLSSVLTLAKSGSVFLGLAFTIAASFPFFPKRLSLKKKNAAFWKVSFIRPYTGIATVRNQCIQFIQRFERIESSAPLLASAAARLPKAPHGEDQLCAFCTLQAVGFPWSESTPGISFVDWSDKIYVKQVFGAQANWVQVGMPHMRANWVQCKNTLDIALSVVVILARDFLTHYACKSLASVKGLSQTHPSTPNLVKLHKESKNDKRD